VPVSDGDRADVEIGMDCFQNAETEPSRSLILLRFRIAIFAGFSEHQTATGARVVPFTTANIPHLIE
jgi:hypothetical protein